VWCRLLRHPTGVRPPLNAAVLARPHPTQVAHCCGFASKSGASGEAQWPDLVPQYWAGASLR